MTRLVLLHTNDIHGNVEGLARVATLVERERATAGCPVVYVDAGDIEESTLRISNVTKGTALHRVLGAAGCQAAAVGNASWLSYGPQVLPACAAEAPYPLLLANLRGADGSPLAGTQDTALLDAGGVRLGLIGVTAPMEHDLESFGLSRVEAAPLVQGLARSLREAGADVVVVLSHLGLGERDDPNDRELAALVASDVDAIVGAHSHDVLPEGERIGPVLVAQAGDQAAYLGRIEFDGAEPRASLIPVGEDVPLHPAVLAAAASVEPEIGALLAEVVGELPWPLDVEGAGAWLAGVLRARLGADVGIVTPGMAFTGSLPAGPLTRGALADACDSRANPGAVTLSDERLLGMLERGADPEFARSTHRALRGRERGLLQVSAAVEVEAGCDYRVAATDWELEPYGGLIDATWNLRPEYDFPTILREAIEEHLR